MPDGARGTGPLRITALLFGRELGARLASPWLYVVATGLCLGAWVYGGGFQRSFETESVLVSANPLAGLDALVIAVLGLVLGLRLTGSMAWEREHRTLEVLLLSPATWTSVILAKVLAEICVLVILVLAYAAYLLATQPLGPGVVGWAEAVRILPFVAFAMPMLSLGVVVGVWARSVRAAVTLFIVVSCVLAIYEATRFATLSLPPDSMSLSALYARQAVVLVEPAVEPLSAMAHLVRPLEASAMNLPLTGTAWAEAVALAFVTLALAVVAGRRRGAVA